MPFSTLLRYLRLPLRFSPLCLIILFAILLTAAEFGGLYGIFTFVVIGSWFLKYGFSILDNVVEGRTEPPVFSFDLANPIERRPIGLLLILFALYSATEPFRPFAGDTAVEVARLILLGFVPAMIAAMSVSGRVLQALNPIAVFGTVMRIPLAYGMLLAVIGSLWLMAAWVLQTSDYSLTDLWRKESFLPGHLISTIGMKGVVSGFFRMVVLMYLWLAMFACIGGTIYEARLELGVEAAEAPERKAAKVSVELERQRDKIMDRIMAEVRGGAFANAGETVRKQIDEAAVPLEECRWLYARAQSFPDQRLADFVAELTLPRLLSVGATGEALSMVRERLNLSPEFKPRTGGQLLQLAQLARNAGDRATLRRLLADFEQRYPNDSLLAVALKMRQEI